jgi:hypothetical protein
MAGDKAPDGWIPFFFISARRVPRSREGMPLLKGVGGYHLFDISSVDHVLFLKILHRLYFWINVM